MPNASEAPANDFRSPISNALFASGQVITIATLAVWPWLFAGVLPETKFALATCASLILSLLLLAMLVATGPRLQIPIAVWLLIAAMILAAFQTVPLPETFLNIVAPTSAEVWNTFGQSPEASADNPISISAADTRRELPQLWIAAVFLLAGASFVRSPRMTTALLWALTVNGAALTIFAIVQRASWNGHIYWTVGTPTMKVFGPFVNHNNAGGYLLMCLAASLGIMAWRVQGRIAPAAVASITRQRQTTLLGQLSDRLDWVRLSAITLFFDARFLVITTFAVIIAGGVLITLSRGAFLGLLSGGCLVALLVSRRGYRGALTVAVGIAFGAIALVAWIRDAATVRDRLATLLDSSELTSARILHLQEAIQMIPDYWRTGCGIGAYRYANGMYRQSPYEGLFHYVENQYVETVIVGGVLAALLLLFAMYFAFRDTWRLTCRESSLHWGVSVFAASLFGGQLLAAAFDFGWYIPANMIAFAAGTGLIHAFAAGEKGDRPTRQHSWHRFAAVAVLIGFGVFSVGELRSLALAGAITRKIPNYARQERNEPLIDNNVILDEIERLELALDHRPGDRQALGMLGEKFVRLARGQIYEALAAEMSSGANTRALWAFSSLPYVNVAAHSLSRSGNLERLSSLRSRPEVTGPMARAYDCFKNLVADCPLAPSAHYHLAQLGLLVEGDSSVWRKEVPIAMALAPQDSDLRWRFGIMEISAGNIQHGCELLNESIALAGKPSPRMIFFACHVLTPEDFAAQAMPQKTRWLLQFIDRHLSGERRRDFRLATARRATELLVLESHDHFERWMLEAKALGYQDLFEEAETTFVKGLRRFPRYWELHYEFGRFLERQRRLEEALQQYGACAAARPDSQPYADAVACVRRKLMRNR